MRNLIPCPSPRGTNRERLFLIRHPNLGVMAQDAAMPPDSPSNNGADAYEELATFLQQNLSPDVLAEAETLLRRFVDQSGNLATDEPEAFSGQPRVGGSMERNGTAGRVEPNPPQAGRDARMSFDERLAVAAQVRTGRKQAEQYLFAQRFPNAARIRNV